MSRYALPTPPSSASKENAAPSLKRRRSVVWSSELTHTQLIDTLSLSTPRKIAPLPKRGILKPTTVLPFSQLDEHEPLKEPESPDPITDPEYLTAVVKRVLEGSVTDRVEAYSILSARLRSSLDGKDDIDSSWPIFCPLRSVASEFAGKLASDTGKALEDPCDDEFSQEEGQSGNRVQLPSPTKEEPGKKRGMTAAQVIRARDICSLVQACMRVLATIFSFPALYRVFRSSHISKLLAKLTSIPLHPALPSLNSRKTYAISINTISTLCTLPSSLLKPLSEAVTYALKRAVSGELGKEGKRGACSDGLRCIATLALSHPETFLPSFSRGELLDCILKNLTHTSLNIRALASHALGGFALAMTKFSCPEERLSSGELLSKYLSTFGNKVGSPSKENVLVRHLRLTLENADSALHISSTGYWALSVIPSLIIILSPVLSGQSNSSSPSQGHDKARAAIFNLLNLAIRSKKSSIRSLAHIVWASLGWAGIQGLEAEYAVTVDSCTSSEPSSPNVSSQGQPASGSRQKVSHSIWKTIKSITDCGVGVSVVAALSYRAIASEPSNEASPQAAAASMSSPLISQLPAVPDEERAKHIFDILGSMLKRNEKGRVEAVGCLGRLVGVSLESTRRRKHRSQPGEEEDDDLPYTPTRGLLPESLFACHEPGGLLTLDTNVPSNVAAVVRAINSELGSYEDITPLLSETLSKDWVWKKFCETWLLCTRSVASSSTYGNKLKDQSCYDPSDLQEIFCSMVRNVLRGLASHKQRIAEQAAFLEQATLFLVETVLQDSGVSFVSPTATNSSLGKFAFIPIHSGASSTRNVEDPDDMSAMLKLSFVRDIWNGMRGAVSWITNLAECAAQCQDDSESQAIASNMVENKPLLGSALALLSHLTGKADLYIDSTPWGEFLAEVMLELDYVAAQTTPAFSIPGSVDSPNGANTDSCTQCGKPADDGDLLACLWGFRQPPSFSTFCGRPVSSLLPGNWKNLMHEEWCISTFATAWCAFTKRWAREMEDASGTENDDSSSDKSTAEPHALWEGACLALCAPFVSTGRRLPDDAQQHWENFLSLSMKCANGGGVNAVGFLSYMLSFLEGEGIDSASGLNKGVQGAQIQILDLVLVEFARHLSSFCTPSEVPPAVTDVLGFIGRMLCSTYPPVERNAAPGSWMIISLATVVDACPTNLKSAMIKSLGQGIGLWIGDASSCIEDWDYANAFLLNTTLESLKPLVHVPTAEQPSLTETTILTLQMLSTVFSGREDKRLAMVDSVKDWWDTIGPRETWLGPREWIGSPPVEAESAPCDEGEVISPTKDSYLEDEFHELPPTRPCTPTSYRCSASASPASRPQKTPSNILLLFEDLDDSDINSRGHLVHLTPSRKPLTSRTTRVQSSPVRTPGSNKRRRIVDGDKENRSPALVKESPLFTPVEDRIASLSSPQTEKRVSPFKLGSKRLSDGHGEDSSRVKKRSRVALDGSPSIFNSYKPWGRKLDENDETERSDVEMSLLKSPDFSSSSSDSSATPPSSSNKRKRKVMDSVEVPRVADVYGVGGLRLSKSLDSSSYVCKTPVKAELDDSRKTKSIEPRKSSVLVQEEVDDLFGGPILPRFPLSLLPSPNKAEIGSDDTMDFSSPSPSTKKILSSDDEPHIGQITPQHLVSPTLARRSSNLLTLPPSPIFTCMKSDEICDEFPDYDDLFSEHSEAEGSPSGARRKAKGAKAKAKARADGKTRERERSRKVKT